jgi:hypothetical protein
MKENDMITPTLIINIFWLLTIIILSVMAILGLIIHIILPIFRLIWGEIADRFLK